MRLAARAMVARRGSITSFSAGERRGRFEADCGGGLEVDNQFELKLTARRGTVRARASSPDPHRRRPDDASGSRISGPRLFWGTPPPLATLQCANDPGNWHIMTRYRSLEV